jgi:hypothetical protein
MLVSFLPTDGRLTLQPHIDKPRTPDASVSLPATQGVHSTYFPSSFEGLEEVARQSMLLIMLQSHRAVWPPVDTTNFPPAETLTVCVNLYYKHFHAWLPIIESSAPVTRDANPLLLMAMSAIGAMYSRDGLQRLGIALNELVRRATLYIVSHATGRSSRDRERTIDGSCTRRT